MRFCASAGCSAIVTRGHCAEHAHVRRQAQRCYQTGETSYSSARWRRLRAEVLREEPLCRDRHVNEDCTIVSEEVDHIRPHRGDPVLFLARENLAGRCKRCHSRKTAREVGFAGGRA